VDVAEVPSMPGNVESHPMAEDEGRSRLWVDYAPAALPLLLFGLLAVGSSWFSNNFNPSDAFWFVAGPAGCWILAYAYRRQRLQAAVGATGPDGMYVKAGFILLAAQSLIVLLAVDAPLGVAFLLLGAALRIGSKWLAGWAVVFGLIAGMARYAVFNRLLGQAPHTGLVTPLVFALDGAILLAAGVVAWRREAAWGPERLYPSSSPEGTPELPGEPNSAG
jgi:hypothetical protein